jgi:hypothetical protein
VNIDNNIDATRKLVNRGSQTTIDIDYTNKHDSESSIINEYEHEKEDLNRELYLPIIFNGQGILNDLTGVYMYVFLYIYVYIYVFLYMCVCIYVCMYVYICTYVYTFVYKNVCICIYIHVFIYIIYNYICLMVRVFLMI